VSGPAPAAGARRIKDAYCSYCGSAYPADHPWPRVCAACGQTTWRNPTPVAVCVLPVDDGVLLIRREIEPHRGRMALPGGYVDFGETWQQGCARELVEETGITIDPAEVEHVATLSPPDGTVVLIFGRARPRRLADLPEFKATSETSALVVATSADGIAFPLHRQVMDEHFRIRRATHPGR
jgi:ADP-ribose pyrophosphatase YjhB (NUDIX family)